MSTPTHPAFEYDDDDSWSTLALWLTPQVRGWVYNTTLLCWKGDEEAITEDIVAVAVTRIYMYIKKGNVHMAKPVISMSAFARRTARNCYIDQLRKDRKKVRLSQLTDDYEKPVLAKNLPSMEESVHERLFREQLIGVIAQEISHFPAKQQEAILRDQARLIDCMPDPASLLRAYHEAGIRILDYRSQEPMKKDERYRHSSLLHHAYKRLSLLPSVRKFI
jgi:DNA-directed RNA polymerase specialized sigma24 family protein